MGSEFGHAVRSWRERIHPADLGLPVGIRRRAAGLRREELADLAGISVDYLTRLEQGRASSPSSQVASTLARALRLADRERELLFRLADLAPPAPGAIPTHVSPSVQRMLDRFVGTPVIVYDAIWNLIDANAAYDAVMGEASSWTGWERNAVWRALHGVASRARVTPGERAHLQEQLVSDLRMTAARYPDAPTVNTLVRELTRTSPRFVELWQANDVGDSATPARHKVVDHPAVGPIELDCDTMVIAGDDLRVMIYTVDPHAPDASRLRLAVTLGTHAAPSR